MYDLEGIAMEEVARTLGRSEGAAYMLRARRSSSRSIIWPKNSNT
jgi:hypothetical protein